MTPVTGRSLAENEVRQLRYNAVMREAAKIQGAAAAATGSAEMQSAALAREVNELKEAVGEQFQGYLRSWVGHLRDLVGFLKDNSDWLVKFGEAAIFVAGAIVTYGIITKIAGIASAVEGLALALTVKLRHRGLELVDWMFSLVAAAYNLVRIRNLVTAIG